MRKRSIRHGKKRRNKKEVLDLDITSLLDILVILLVFLLKSYNSTGVVFNVPKDVVLPKSESSSVSTAGVLVQASASKIWVDDKEILNTQNLKGSEKRLHNRYKRIIPLYNELVKKRQVVQQVEKSSPNAQKFSGIVNLMIDKKMKYHYLKRILHTCAEAGYGKYKFVVLGEEI